MTEVETNEKYPTYFRPNRFLKPYQDMTDSYGVPRYQEINPCMLAIFFDLFHGVC